MKIFRILYGIPTSKKSMLKSFSIPNTLLRILSIIIFTLIFHIASKHIDEKHNLIIGNQDSLNLHILYFKL